MDFFDGFETNIDGTVKDYMGVKTRWGDGDKENNVLGALEYQTRIPKLSVWRLNISITGVPTILGEENIKMNICNK
jgi:hypothetical protein